MKNFHNAITKMLQSVEISQILRVEAYLGIDAGCTTIKAVVIGSDNEILDELYQSNLGDPIPIIKEHSIDLYEQYPNIQMKCSDCYRLW